jgi:DeoR family fructose operon transcriptional repressor
MLAEERRAILIQELNNNGYIQVADLAEQFSTSAATIRRDLYQLEKEGLCIRKRGGAVRSSQGVTLELPYSIKQNRAMEEKKRIAEAAEQLVEEGDTILLDAGSTTYALAARLVVNQRITVVTNDLHIAVKLAGNPNITLITTGGVARPYVFSLQGWQTESFIRNLKVDKTFLGADAIHADGMVANVNIDEVAIKQAMIEAADQVILLADSSKFDKTGFFKVCSLARISKVITDRGITKDNLELIRSFNTQTVTV